MQIAISGIDADVASPGSVVVSVTQCEAEEIASAQKTKTTPLRTSRASRPSWLPCCDCWPRAARMSELSSAVGAAESRVSARRGRQGDAETDYNTAYEGAWPLLVGRLTLTHCPTEIPLRRRSSRRPDNHW